jgi:hypothetical protein
MSCYFCNQRTITIKLTTTMIKKKIVFTPEEYTVLVFGTECTRQQYLMRKERQTRLSKKNLKSAFK